MVEEQFDNIRKYKDAFIWGSKIADEPLPISFYRENSLILLLISAFFLVLVLIPGIGLEVNGSRRWLPIGPINIQPSEIAKIFLPIYLCSYCLRRKEQLESTLRGFC